MLGNQFATIGWPSAGEIDIMENTDSRGTDINFGTIHGPGYSGGNGNNISNWKGRLLFEQNPGTSLPLGPEHLVTLVDCNPGKTLFTPGHRPGNDPCDSFIGLDRGNVNFDKAGISLGAPGSLSNYIGNIGDGTNWKERLTANLKAFQVPITTNAPISSTLATGTPPLLVESSTPVPKLFVANHPSLQNCGKTEICSAVPVKNGQVVFGRVTLSGGIATVRNLNPGFSDSGSFQCTASDVTAAANAANAVPISGSSIRVNGIARDVVSYICAGN